MSGFRLPEKPSELIELALHDLELAEKDGRYRIYMFGWHMPHYGVCHVCFAGAVMAFSLGCDPNCGTGPRQFDAYSSKRFNFLDSARRGSVVEAWKKLSDGYQECPLDDRSVAEYAKNPESFKSDMRGLAREFREAGY